MKAKVCPKCGKQNSADVWNCIDCGETLSINTIVEVDSVAPEAKSNKKQTPDAELYERGKGHFEREDYGAAIKDFQEAIRLNPDNANYYAWLARSFNRTGDKLKTLYSVDKALELDSRCAMALGIRADIYRQQKEYQKALRAFILAIEIEPNNGVYYYNRRRVYLELKDFENYVADKIRSYFLSPSLISKYEAGDSKWQSKHNAWYEAIFQHLKQMVLPQLVSEEAFVEYYPVWFSWQGVNSISTGYDSRGRGTINTVGHTSYGTGYIYITNSNIYVQLFGNLSVNYQHPLFSKPTSPTVGAIGSLVGTLADMALGGSGSGGFGSSKSHYDIREGGDVGWKIPFSSVSSVKTSKELSQDIISIVAPQLSCKILPHFSKGFQEILMSIQMGMSGKTSQIASSMSKASPEQSEPAQTSNPDVFQVLKQLAELKDKGVITEVEFENKKKELLARL